MSSRISIKGRWRRIVSYDVPVLLYAGLIFWLSSQTHTEREKQLLNVVPDVMLHALEFGFLALLLLRQLYQAGRVGNILRATILSLFISASYGVLDELHQGFVPGREMDFRDGVADATGALVFLLLALVYLLRKKELTPPNQHDNL
jgi:VanZ family protein